MNKEEFIKNLYEDLEIESTESIDESTVLTELEEYDSLAILVIIALMDKHFSVKISTKELNELETVGDLIHKAGL
jgi:acyl carrier protein